MSTASGRVTINVGGGGLQAPAQAAAAGYTSLVFEEEFDDTSGIDMSNSRQVGFNFYRFKPFGFGVTPLSELSVANSILTITPTEGSSTGYHALQSTCGIGSNQYVGSTFSGGAYFEGRLAHELVSSNGWPAFWTMSDDHLWEGVGTNFWEVDFYEKLGTATQYGVAVHDWATSSSTDNDINHHETVPGGHDFADFHTYGLLWLPGDRYVAYLDDVAIKTFLFSTFPWLSGGDDKTWPIIIGSGEGWPLDIDWVRVWQAPGTVRIG
jgi:beta-glucanase (GH16 family)